jgi:hypothetical protein
MTCGIFKDSIFLQPAKASYPTFFNLEKSTLVIPEHEENPLFSMVSSSSKQMSTIFVHSKNPPSPMVFNFGNFILVIPEH